MKTLLYLIAIFITILSINSCAKKKCRNNIDKICDSDCAFLLTKKEIKAEDMITLDVNDPIDTTYPYVTYVPNAFTPNGDGINDVFKAEHLNTKSIAMTIRNKNDIIFQTSTIDFWDGMIDGKPAKKACMMEK